MAFKVSAVVTGMIVNISTWSCLSFRWPMRWRPTWRVTRARGDCARSSNTAWRTWRKRTGSRSGNVIVRKCYCVHRVSDHIKCKKLEHWLNTVTINDYRLLWFTYEKGTFFSLCILLNTVRTCKLLYFSRDEKMTRKRCNLLFYVQYEYL